MYIDLRQDAWCKTRFILYPVSHTVLRTVAPLPYVPYITNEEAQDVLIEAVAAVMHAACMNHAEYVTLVLTAVHDTTVLLCGSNLPPGIGTLTPPPGGLVEGSASGTHAIVNLNFRPSCNHLASLFHAAVSFVLATCESRAVQLMNCYATYCTDLFHASVCIALPSPMQPGVLLTVIDNVQVCVRSGHVLPDVVPVLSLAGTVLTFRRRKLSPLFAHVYLRVEMDVSVATMDRVLNQVTGTLSLAAPHAPLAPAPASLPDALPGSEKVVSCFAESSLFASLVYCLRNFCAGVDTVSDVLTHYPRPSVDLPIAVKAVMMAKARSLVHLHTHEQDSVKSDLRAALETPLDTLRVCDGIVFDVLLHNTSLENIPSYFHPTALVDDAEGVGLYTVLYLLQWRFTLTRLVEVIGERSHELRCDAASFARFRTGLLVQSPGCVLVKSAHRVVDGTHCFCINLGNRDMFQLGGKNCLQQQRAEDRNVVVAYLFGEALKLLAPLVQGDAQVNVAAVLTEGYMAALKPKCFTNLAKVYERTQHLVRRIRQEVTLVRQAESGIDRARRK